ncbi:MAG: hypothetical protein NTX49_10165 [Chlamydiae bacterium]|nr:hypothetical protein [Chlamydiota bacterium]
MATVPQVMNSGVTALEGTQTPRSASRAHARPPIDDSVGRIITTFEKALADLTARLGSLEGENASLRERLITAEAHSAEKETTAAAALAAQAATITGLTETVSALTGRIDTLQRDVGPVIAKHYEPPPLPTRQCSYISDGRPTGEFYTETYMNGEWKHYYNGAWR